MAQALSRKAKKNEAAAKFREVLAIEPANLEAIGFLEPFLSQSRKYTDLRDVLLAAGGDATADIELRQSWLREVAGLCETQLHDADGAIVALKELLVLDADDEPAQTLLKRLLEKEARWDELAALLANEAEQNLGRRDADLAREGAGRAARAEEERPASDRRGVGAHRAARDG